MKIFLAAQDFDLWSVVIHGIPKPTITVDGKEIDKPVDQWNATDKKNASLNAKAMNALYCSLDKNEYNRISQCDSAKEIWDKLEITHEGTNQVKESKMNLLVHEYELFKMKEHESISEMFTRFTDILNALKALGRTYDNAEKVRKILRCLPRSWNPKVTAIQEAKDLKTLPLEELLGSLETHELDIKRHSMEDEDNKKKKGIALKVHSDSDCQSDSEEDELALINRKVKKLMRNRQRNSQRFKEHAKEDVICYKCKKTGHMRHECPKYKGETSKEKRYFKKKKAMTANWESDSSISSDSDSSTPEGSKFCLMAKEGTNEQQEVIEEVSDSSDSFDDLSYDKLLVSFNTLYVSNSTLKKELERIKLEKKNMIDELEKLNAESKTLVIENEKLKIENEKLNGARSKLEISLSKLTAGKNNLDAILGSQRCVFDKSGLGYNPVKHEKYYKNYFVKQGSYQTVTTFVTCNFCNRKGHNSQNCMLKKSKRKKVWVRKDLLDALRANPKGPKVAWVPKT